MDIELLKRKFSIEMISGKNLTDRCCMCDNDFLSKSYEEGVLDMVQYEDYYAMFIKHNDTNIAECVFHLTSPTICTIEVLCTRKNSVGAATMLMCSLLDKLKNFGCKYVMLYVARYEKNQRAIKFYEKFGFINTQSNQYILNLATYPGECVFLKNIRQPKKRERSTTSSSSNSRNNNKRQEKV
jgi:hypothetical protein